MPPRTVKAAEDILKRVEQDIERLEVELDQLRGYADALRFGIARYSDDESLAAAVIPQSQPDDPPNGSRVRVETKVVRNTLVDILHEAGHPMHARDLLAALSARGVVVNGKDPTNNVRSHLSHDTRFRSIGSGNWELVSRNQNQVTPPPRLTDVEFLDGANPEINTVGVAGTDRPMHENWTRRLRERSDFTTAAPLERELSESELSREGPRAQDRLLTSSSTRSPRDYGDMADVPF